MKDERPANAPIIQMEVEITVRRWMRSSDFREAEKGKQDEQMPQHYDAQAQAHQFQVATRQHATIRLLIRSGSAQMNRRQIRRSLDLSTAILREKLRRLLNRTQPPELT